MSFTAPTRDRVGPLLPLASMVDVLFLLLIFFMTASVFREQEKQIDVSLPGQETPSEGGSKTQIVITITADGVIHMGENTFDLGQLRATLTRLAQQFPNESVVIRGDRDSSLGLTVQVLDTARAAGLRNVFIATTKAASEL